MSFKDVIFKLIKISFQRIKFGGEQFDSFDKKQ